MGLASERQCHEPRRMQPPPSQPVKCIFRKRYSSEVAHCLIFVASVSPLKGDDLFRTSGQQHGVENTDLLCRTGLPRALRTRGRTRGRLKYESRLLDYPTARKASKLTDHVTVASDLPSEALDRSCHLIYLAVAVIVKSMLA